MSERAEIEKIARELCAADGWDPAMKVIPPGYVLQNGPRGSHRLPEAEWFAWYLYMNEARFCYDYMEKAK